MRHPGSTASAAPPMVEWLGEHPHATADEARAKALDIAGAARPRRGHPPARVAAARCCTLPSPSRPPGRPTRPPSQRRARASGPSPTTRTSSIVTSRAWHDRPLGSIKREDVVQEHAAITERARKARAGQKYSSGKYAANGTMRFRPGGLELRQGRTGDPGLPERNPFRSGKLFHKEKARNTGWALPSCRPGGHSSRRSPIRSAANCTCSCCFGPAPHRRPHRAMGKL